MRFQSNFILTLSSGVTLPFAVSSVTGCALFSQKWRAYCPAATAADSVSSIRRTRLTPKMPSRLRSEEHTSELQSLMRISYAVFCLKKKKKKNSQEPEHITK